MSFASCLINDCVLLAWWLIRDHVIFAWHLFFDHVFFACCLIRGYGLCRILVLHQVILSWYLIHDHVIFLHDVWSEILLAKHDILSKIMWSLNDAWSKIMFLYVTWSEIMFLLHAYDPRSYFLCLVFDLESCDLWHGWSKIMSLQLDVWSKIMSCTGLFILGNAIFNAISLTIICSLPDILYVICLTFRKIFYPHSCGFHKTFALTLRSLRNRIELRPCAFCK